MKKFLTSKISFQDKLVAQSLNIKGDSAM